MKSTTKENNEKSLKKSLKCDKHFPAYIAFQAQNINILYEFINFLFPPSDIYPANCLFISFNDTLISFEYLMKNKNKMF